MSSELYKIVIGGYCIGYGYKEDMDNQALDIPGARVLRMDERISNGNYKDVKKGNDDDYEVIG